MKALAFFAGDGENLGRFLALSGLHLEDLRERVEDPLLLAGVLDFLLGDDKLLEAFAESEGMETKIVHAARRALPGAAPEV